MKRKHKDNLTAFLFLTPTLVAVSYTHLDVYKRQGRFSGFCYTQLTDVMQEVNGLLDMDRNPKAPLERLKEIFGREFY